MFVVLRLRLSPEALRVGPSLTRLFGPGCSSSQLSNSEQMHSTMGMGIGRGPGLISPLARRLQKVVLTKVSG